jgi:hypothetical protein
MKYFVLFLTLLGIQSGYAQGSLLPLHSPSEQILERWDILYPGALDYHAPVRGNSRKDVVRRAFEIDSLLKSSRLDKWDQRYLFRENNEWLYQDPYIKGHSGSRVEWSMQSIHYDTLQKPFLAIFYPTPANFLELNRHAIHLRVNPILNLRMGRDLSNDRTLFNNQRGLELRGGIDDRYYFYTQILETQAAFPAYVNRRIERDRAIPGNGFFKRFNSTLFNSEGSYDFLNAQGYFGFHISRHVGLQMGHGRHFIGNGHRSLLLSDFSNNYFYLKLHARVWKLHYQTIIAELAAASNVDVPNDRILPKKYFVAHHLSFNISPTFNIGLFESVVFSRNDQFELQYLNPIILYRSVEQMIGSPDNVSIGLDARLNLFRSIQLYGQLMLDEFKLDEALIERRGWWGNKYGLQAGLKYVNVAGIDHLDAQLEFNLVRPYTYTHRDSSANYAHYNQPLAHPLGANFREGILRLNFRPAPRWELAAHLLWAQQGNDLPNQNWGGHILLPNGTREQEYGNELLQGLRSETSFARLRLSYAFMHNGYLELEAIQRIKTWESTYQEERLFYFGGGIRLNVPERLLDF